MFFDSLITKAKPRKTKDGYLVASCKAARIGVQEYMGSEVGRPELNIVRVYRPEDEVFNKDSLATFAHKPVTINHPEHGVTAQSWRDNAVGQLSGEVLRDGDHITMQLALMDSDAIAAYESGEFAEVSMGYDADIEWQAGVTDKGVPYDAIQRNIKVNHLALVEKGRAGSARINDNQPKHTGDNMVLEKVKFGDVTIETTKSGAEAIAALETRIEDVKADIAKLQGELATKDAKIEELSKSQVTDAAISDAVVKRSALIVQATKIADADYSALSDADIKLLAVKTALGDEVVKDKPAAYVDARFDILLEQAEKQSQQPVDDGKPDPSKQTLGDAYAEYEQKLTQRGV